MTQTITVSDIIPATPEEIYAAWLDSAAHAAMTGGAKAEASPEVGAEHSAWDGYISGMNLALHPGLRIEQSWRSSDFAAEDADSTLTVLLEPVAGGTKVTLVHSDVPDHQASFADAWRDYYFEPMKAYFGALLAPMVEPVAEPAPKAPRARKVPAKKPAAAKKTAARKPAAAKKAAAKKSAVRKVAGKKPAAKRATAKKPAAKKAAAKKAGARKVVKKPAAKKAGATRKIGRKRRR